MYFVPRRCSLQCCRMTRQSGHYIIHTALGLLLAAGSSSAFIATKGAAPVLTQQCTKLKCSRISIESRSRSPPRKRSSELRARQRASDPPGGLTSSDFSRETLQILNDMLERVESKATEPPLAAFDADGTLWETDACLEYMQHMERTRGWEQVDTVGTYEALLKAKGKERAYGYCAQLFDGMSLDGISRSCAESFQANVKATVFPEMAELLRILKARGWEVAVVTASPTWVVVPGAVDLGLKESDVIGIDVEVSGNRATDRVKYPLSFGPGKPQRLRMVYPASRPLALAAGNSRDDFALMQEVSDHGLSLFVDSRAIRGTQELVGEALERQWLVHTPGRIRGRAHRA